MGSGKMRYMFQQSVEKELQLKGACIANVLQLYNIVVPTLQEKERSAFTTKKMTEDANVMYEFYKENIVDPQEARDGNVKIVRPVISGDFDPGNVSPKKQ